jgi:hypothetical protein
MANSQSVVLAHNQHNPVLGPIGCNGKARTHPIHPVTNAAFGHSA